MKKLLASIVTAVLCVTSFCFPASAEWQKIKVKIAPFKTEIDYMSVDNRYVQYPLITYKDITYFPMTFDLCGRLGLMSTYTDADGLYITRTTSSFSVNENYFGGSAKNSYKTSYNASIPEYPIYLNGIFIDNKTEEYPLINFRGITYFPMTWRFAYEELCFDIEWSEKDYSFKLYNNGSTTGLLPVSADKNNVYMSKNVAVYDESVNENGDTVHTYSYNYNENCVFDTQTESLSRLEDTAERQDGIYSNNHGKIEKTEIEVKTENNVIYMGGTRLVSIGADDEVTGASAYEYKLKDSSLISLTVFLGTAPAPYTTKEYLLIAVNKDGIQVLDWEKGAMLSDVYQGVNGEYYICTNGYSLGSSRYSNGYSDVYMYNADSKELISFADKYSEKINSVKAIGMADGKLYVQAMWYANKKDEYASPMRFSSINSGYYEIDLATGKMTKLYPYILGETFVAPNGTLYCIGTYSRIQRIINLNTGKIIPVQ